MEADAIRRRPQPELDLRSNPDLLALITDEIRRTGPITFARFMDLALYAPDLGYYTSPAARIGRGGDFLTAPEMHPIFGATLARHVAAVWHRLGEPDGFPIREYGAGTGALARSILAALATEEPSLAQSVTYEAVEINPDRRRELASDRAPSNGEPGQVLALDPDAAARRDPVATGIVLANEFLDAFPVHRVEQTADGLHERFVDVGPSGLCHLIGAPSTPLLAERLRGEDIELAVGQVAEIALGLDGWFAEVGTWLRSGVVVVIDYGDPADRLYGPRHPAGSLVGYLDHRVVDDPLVAVGRQDLTAHVDFTAVEHASTRAGLTVIGVTTQSAFLIDLGLQDLLERARSDPRQGLGDYLELRSSLVRLLDPRQTGGFRVLVAGRGIQTDPPLPGLRRLAR